MTLESSATRGDTTMAQEKMCKQASERSLPIKSNAKPNSHTRSYIIGIYGSIRDLIGRE